VIGVFHTLSEGNTGQAVPGSTCPVAPVPLWVAEAAAALVTQTSDVTRTSSATMRAG
jgi:hypothetical protein